MVKQKELDEMSDNINESFEKIYKENFPEYEVPKIKIIQGVMNYDKFDYRWTKDKSSKRYDCP